MLRKFLSELKLSLKMNGPAMALFLAQKKKTQERQLICKRKRDARRRFQAYVRRRHVVTQLFVLLLTRNINTTRSLMLEFLCH